MNWFFCYVYILSHCVYFTSEMNNGSVNHLSLCCLFSHQRWTSVQSAICHCVVCFTPELNHGSVSHFLLRCLFYTWLEPRLSPEPFVTVLLVLHQRWTTVQSAISHCVVCFTPKMNHGSVSHFSLCCLFHTRDETRFSQPFVTVLFVLHQRWTTVKSAICHCLVCFTQEMNHGSANYF